MSEVARFHPATARWWSSRFAEPTEAQRGAWPAWQRGEDVLVSAPTGSGKTLAAFLAAIDALVQEAARGELDDRLRVLYVSPLKALGNDVERNLREPLAGIGRALQELVPGAAEIRVAVRSGDTKASQRRSQLDRPPHLLVTTPESLYLLLTSERGREALRSVETVIIDEIHAVAGDRRGSHLSLSLARLDALCPVPPRRVGLSATARPLETMVRLLVGADPERVRRCTQVVAPSRRGLDAALLLPEAPLEAVLSAEARKDLVARVAALCATHGQTLVFVGTRRMAERYAAEIETALRQQLAVDPGEAPCTLPHHGSLSRAMRLHTEQALREGSLRVCVATASLELGIDIGAVDLVVQIGSPRAASVLLQRAGRSRHQVGATPKVRVAPTTLEELVECAALLGVVTGRLQSDAGALEATLLEDAPLDVLAQQIVAECAQQPWQEDALFALVRSAAPYASLSRERFDAVLEMLAEGIAARRGRRAAWLHRDRVGHEVRGRRGARLVALTSGGAIPDAASYDVVLHASEQKVGTLHEDFAIESTPGDVFVLGSAPWRIVQVQSGKVRVEAAPGMQPSLPFWFGEGPSRSDVGSAAVRALQQGVEAALRDGDEAAATAWLHDTLGLQHAAAEQIAEFLAVTRRGLGALPGRDTLILERFFDRSGGMQLVLHSPYGSRVNRAFGLALRKRFCRRFNFELQAAATDDAILLSLGETHAFPLEEVWDYLRADVVRDVLVQAVLASPLFTTRWRWAAGRALAVPRFRGGRKLPPNLQRMEAEDLIAVVFPDQIACAENLAGAREVPDHPLVDAAIHDTLHEAMDLPGLVALLRRLEGTEGAEPLRRLEVDAREPSPLALNVVNAAVYTFLDDAPLEERRAAAVASRNWRTAGDDMARLGQLDPAAVQRVRDTLRPDPQDAAELHDALDISGWLEDDEVGSAPAGALSSLRQSGRAGRFASGAATIWIAAERLALVGRALTEGAAVDAMATVPESSQSSPTPPTPDEALRELLRARLGCEGPCTAAGVARRLGVATERVDAALHALEAEGFCLRGSFDLALAEQEPRAQQWCERRVLGRIHRATLEGLRRAVAAVPLHAYVRFLRRWHGVGLPSMDARYATTESAEAALRQLAGWQAPLVAWEEELLPARLRGFDAGTLDSLMLSGRFCWLRLDVPQARGGSGPVRNTPIAMVPRADLATWLRLARAAERPLSTEAAAVLAELGRGAAFTQDLADALRLPTTRVDAALAELVAAGRARSDALGGLRAMLRPAAGRGHPRRGRRVALDVAGRWVAIAREWTGAGADEPTPDPSLEALRLQEDDVAAAARWLLDRWGVLSRRVVQREPLAPPWRLLLRALWRMEARGEIRGGRFIAGLSGEQFALPDAIPLLRACRDGDEDVRTREDVVVAAHDPLNIAGWLLEGPKVPALADHRILLRGGALLATRCGGKTTFEPAAPRDPAERWRLEKALAQVAGRPLPAALHARA